MVPEDDTGVPFYATAKTSNDDAFDCIIGAIEDIIVEKQFQNMLNNFLETYWREFDDHPEHKLEYTEIFNEYTDQIEKFIEHQLTAKYPGFDMEKFVEDLEEKIKKEQWEGEVFEVLATFSDFVAFREMFNDYKSFKLGNSADLSGSICVTRLPQVDRLERDD